MYVYLALSLIFIWAFLGRVSQRMYRTLMPRESRFGGKLNTESGSFSYDVMPLLWPILVPMFVAHYLADKLIDGA